MMKPPNIRYVYPLTKLREEVVIPDHLSKKDALIVFNAEADRPDDVMYDQEQQASLQIQINDAMKEGLGVVVLAPPALAASLT